MLFSAGDHVPAIPLSEVVGSAFKVAPEQIGATAVKDGVIDADTTIVWVTIDAHCPAFGVNVYVVVAELFSAGDHVPDIPLDEVVGNAFKLSPAQIGATAGNVGVVPGVTVTVTVF